MSRYLDLEQALAQCNQGQFEKVVGQVLHARGVPGLSLVGSVVGKHKTRTGIPDAFGLTRDGRFSFYACTTESGAAAVKAKLKEDLETCAETDRTGVPREKIDAVYLAFNSVLSADAAHEVQDHGHALGLRVEFLPLSALAGELQRFPWIAKDEFGIEIDTGQVLSIDAFVTAYDQGLLATPLATQFLFRDALLASSLGTLQQRDLLIAGPAGTGKTRFGLELLRRLAAQGFEPRVVHSADRSLFEDLPRHFAQPSDYAVLVDDANRVNGLEQVLKIIRHRAAGGRVCVILTVRDYAVDECRAALEAQARRFEQLTLGPFSYDETDAFLEQAFGIRNRDARRHIWVLSKGNARLATMAARTALETDSIASILNVTTLYRAYYRGVVAALEEGTPSLLDTLALVAVFRVLRASDRSLLEAIECAFGYASGSLWPAVLALHRLECVSVYEQRVAKVSDQILGTYAFFVAFVERRSLAFATLFGAFANTHLDRIREQVYACLNTLDHELVLSRLGPTLCAAIRAASDEAQLQLLEHYWFLERDLALAAAACQSDREPVPAPSGESSPSFHRSRTLRLLAHFVNDQERRGIALDIAIALALRAPAWRPFVCSLLTGYGGFGVDQYSAEQDYRLQRDVAERMTTLAADGTHGVALFCDYANGVLVGEVEAHVVDEDRFLFSYVPLQPSEALRQWRACVWAGLETLATTHTQEVRAVIAAYASRRSVHHPDTAVRALEAPYVLQVARAVLQPAVPADAFLVEQLGERLGTTPADWDAWATTFASDATHLARMLELDYDRLAEIDHDQWLAERAITVISAYGDTQPDGIAPLQRTLQDVLATGRSHDVVQAWHHLLDHWGKQSSARLVAMTEAWFRGDDAQRWGIGAWAFKLVAYGGREEAWRVVNLAPPTSRTEWRLAFYCALPPDQVTSADGEALLGLLTHTGVAVPWVRALRPFAVHAGFLAELVTRVLNEREDASHALQSLLGHIDAESLAHVREQFASCPAPLADAYLRVALQADAHAHFDYQSVLFDLLLSLQPDFLTRYVKAKVNQAGWLHEYSEHRDTRRLWSRTDWRVHFLDLLHALVRADRPLLGTYAAAWLPVQGHESRILDESSLTLLISVVREHAADDDLMQVLFYGVEHVSDEQRLRLLEAFLLVNRNLAAFRRLPLLSSSMSSGGSWVPVYQVRVQFLESVRTLLRSADLLEHRVWIDEKIRAERQCIDHELERDFIGER